MIDLMQSNKIENYCSILLEENSVIFTFLKEYIGATVNTGFTIREKPLRISLIP